MKVYQVVESFFHELDVDRVFSLMSDGTKKLSADLYAADGIEVIEARHEQNAMAMADGYSRATGDIGVCMVGRGPGIAQTGTSLVTARKNGSKLLILVPETPMSEPYDSKGFHQEAYLRTMIGAVETIRSPETVVHTIADVYRRLQRGKGPIAIQIPWDLLNDEAKIPEDWDPSDLAPPPLSGGRIEPEDELIEQVIDHYLDTDATVPPVILAGIGAVDAGAKDAIELLAERTNAILTTTLQARGYFADHSFYAGFVGTFGTNLANEFLAESDFILALGCSLNPHTTDDGRLISEDATIVHVDTDPMSIDRHLGADLGVVGDARATALAVVEGLERDGLDFSDRFWTDRLRKQIAEASSLDEQEYPSVGGRVDPRQLVRRLDQLLPEDRLIVADGGHFLNFVLDGISVTHPKDFVWTLDFSSIGQGLPIGLGSALSGDDRSVITFCGDAGFMMTIQELDTAVRESAPITIIVMNDQALGSEYHQLDLTGKDAAAAQVQTPDLAAIAEKFGAEAYTVRSLDDLQAISDVLRVNPDGPVVIDCRINHEVRHRFYLEYHGF